MSHLITIERMAYGPHGVAHLDGQVVFVRGVVPGEVVRATIDEDHGNYAYAHVDEVVIPSPHRRVPPCSYLPRCGGCPWQHLEYQKQLQAKQANLRDHLERIAKLPDPPLLPPVPSPLEFGYRQRLSLRVEDREIGYYAAASHQLVAIERCLLGVEILNDALHHVQGLVRSLTSTVRRIELAAHPTEPRVVVAMQVEGTWLARDHRLLLRWLEQTPMIQGVVLQSKRSRRVYKNPQTVLFPMTNLPLAVTAGVFAQVNPEANRILVDTVLRFLAPRSHERVVDAYAGVGNFTFPLARETAEVLAIEADVVAAEDFRHNARRLRAENVHLLRDTAERALRTLAARGERIDALVLDPPRSGARESLSAILALRPQRIVYVSCNSSTLARDLAVLSPRYQLERAQVIDLFPQTYHAETVAQLILTC